MKIRAPENGCAYSTGCTLLYSRNYFFFSFIIHWFGFQNASLLVPLKSWKQHRNIPPPPGRGRWFFVRIAYGLLGLLGAFFRPAGSGWVDRGHVPNVDRCDFQHKAGDRHTFCSGRCFHLCPQMVRSPCALCLRLGWPGDKKMHHFFSRSLKSAFYVEFMATLMCQAVF